jgi:hypothetical protein
LPQSFFTILEHPEMPEIVSMAMTLSKAQNDGEFLRESNPEYHKEVQTMAESIKKVRESVKK